MNGELKGNQYPSKEYAEMIKDVSQLRKDYLASKSLDDRKEIAG